MIPTYFERRPSHSLILFAVMLLISNFAFADEVIENIPYKNFIEQNKTWWYNSAIDRSGNFDYFYFGIKIEGDTVIEETEWSKCWLIDVEKNKILPCPIALLREKDRKIYKYHNDFWLDEARKRYMEDSYNEYFINLVCNSAVSLKQWFSYNHNMYYDAVLYEDFILSPEDYPLYDFSSETKQHFWPWSYLRPDVSDPGWTGKFNIPRVINDEDGRQFQAHRMERWCESKDGEPRAEDIVREEENELIIIEGVGIHKMEDYFSSTFLLPADWSYTITGWKPLPTLLMVTLDNDSEVYFRGRVGRNFSLENAVCVGQIIETYKNAGVIYDLMGKEIKIPVAGGIYICNGKKILWR